MVGNIPPCPEDTTIVVEDVVIDDASVADAVFEKSAGIKLFQLMGGLWRNPD
jgi:hypothetical protein